MPPFWLLLEVAPSLLNHLEHQRGERSLRTMELSGQADGGWDKC